MNITVYLGANEGKDSTLKESVRELGTWIGESGHTLVYGGSKAGLMGELAVSALAAGADVIGVEPKMFIESELQMDELTELIVTEDMSERKAKLIELGDIFVAFPGGTGTLEEIAEIMSKSALGLIDSKCIIYNLNGYYDALEKFLRNMIDCGLSSDERQKNIYFVDSLKGIEELVG